ncbi:DUF397 domain-containing protein [Streptomyces adelaidensis]|uniref:DUF397 domain-containing protein n=1 Tax=Streptomyces adelaidensis TaxID=2796465 RepID=UPI0019031CF5|nr:DUF397 domain-containing protein [Streptomyces adelaidensis]
MPQPAWQKSSFSSGGEGNCIEMAAITPSRINLRESDRPHETATAAPRALAHLLRTVKAGLLSR